MLESNKLSRRDFVERAAVAGAVAPYFVSASALGRGGKPGANDRLGIALIGGGGMGRANLANCAKHDDVAVTG
ncbi:MAG: twin-arginine translocation signal domain-containing protein, partial [Planctomycetota bacterium]